MKYYKIKIISLILLSILFIGCNEQNSNGSTNNLLVASGSEMEVFSGDVIQPQTSDTQVEFREEVTTNKKYVSVKTGSIKIVRAN